MTGQPGGGPAAHMYTIESSDVCTNVQAMPRSRTASRKPTPGPVVLPAVLLNHSLSDQTNTRPQSSFVSTVRNPGKTTKH